MARKRAAAPISKNVKVKLTRRTFTFDVPKGTRTERVRRFVRDADGAEHPHEEDITVPDYKRESMTWVLHGAELSAASEAEMIRLVEEEHGAGVVPVSTSDETFEVEATVQV